MNRLLLQFVVAVSGASVLVVEIAGTRILGPSYGVSLFLWSALIGITLAALALGYALGGRIADRGATSAKLGTVLVVAAAWILLIPFLRDPLIRATAGFDLRTAVIVSAIVLFFPPLFLLGMVSPLAIRLRARSLDEVGRVAGDLYALSTVASVVGAIATGFFLVPVLGTRGLMIAVAGALFLAGGLVLVAGRRGAAAAVAGAIVAAGGLVLLVGGAPRAGAGAMPTAWLPSGTPSQPTRVVEKRESAYADVRVLERGNERYLLLDGGAHTIVEIDEGRTLHPYAVVSELALELFDRPGRALLLGLGGGSLAGSFSRAGWEVTAVEIDPVVTAIAGEHFGLRPYHARVEHADARRWMVDHAETFDLIVFDAYGSGAIPFHLVTREAFAVAKSRLAPGGVIALNVEAVGWHHPFVHSIGRTLGTACANVVALPIVEPPDRIGNVLVFGSDRTMAIPDSVLGDPVVALADRYEHWRVVQRLHAWSNRFAPVESPRAPVLTDEHNPVDLWAEGINRAARRELHAQLGPLAYD